MGKKSHYLSYEWLGSNPEVTVEGQSKENYPCSYLIGKNKTVKANAFKKILYHNLYPGIDAEYVFPKGKEGLKYSLIIHPGADISQVKLSYTGAKTIKN